MKPSINETKINQSINESNQPMTQINQSINETNSEQVNNQ